MHDPSTTASTPEPSTTASGAPAPAASQPAAQPSVRTVARRGLSVQGAAVSVPGRRLLAGVTLEARPGERVVLTGPSGLGKTTLLRGLAGLAPLDAGALHLDGRPPETFGWPRWRQRVTFVAQDPAPRGPTLRDALARPFGFRASSRSFPEREARALSEALGLAEAAWTTAPEALSQGERLRAALARALLVRPLVLLLDEPTAPLDDGAAAAVAATLEAHAAAGTAVVAVSHDARLCAALDARLIDLAAFAVAGSP